MRLRSSRLCNMIVKKPLEPSCSSQCPFSFHQYCIHLIRSCSDSHSPRNFPTRAWSLMYCFCSSMRSELIMYFRAYGACGIHFPGSHGVGVVVGMVAFSGSISISRSLKVPSVRSFARRSGGGSKVGHLNPSLELLFTVAWLQEAPFGPPSLRDMIPSRESIVVMQCSVA